MVFSMEMNSISAATSNLHKVAIKHNHWEHTES